MSRAPGGIGIMRSFLFLLIHFLTTLAKLLGPGGLKAVLAENLLVKHQLLVLNRARQRAPALPPVDRMFMGFWTLFMKPRRLLRTAVAIKPTTLLKFHRVLIQRKYRLLFSSRRRGKSGPPGPSSELISTIVAIKQRNPRFGCPRIALIITNTFGVPVDKDVVRRILAKHYRPDRSGEGQPLERGPVSL